MPTCLWYDSPAFNHFRGDAWMKATSGFAVLAQGRP
jgi:hypothetical protein